MPVVRSLAFHILIYLEKCFPASKIFPMEHFQLTPCTLHTITATIDLDCSGFRQCETISWTMFALAIILAVPLERFGAELPWGMPLVGQACICAAAITALEFVTGLVLNVWLGLGVWDYSHLAGNILGQICPQFTLLWLVLSVVGIVILDWMRYAVEGGKKPHYT